MNLDPHGHFVKVCPEHHRVLERADIGEGLMCPAGPDGWHAVEKPLTLDRHTGKEVETPRAEEDDVSKTEETNDRKCPGCGRLKRGEDARDGKPCFKCRRKKGPAIRPVTVRAPAAREAVPADAPASPSSGNRPTLERALFEDPRRAMTMTLAQRRVPKSGGDPYLVRWKITARKGAPGRKGGRAQKGVCATSATEELARKAWLRMLNKAEADGWTRVEVQPKRGRELQIEMFPPAMRRPGRRPKKKAA